MAAHVQTRYVQVEPLSVHGPHFSRHLDYLVSATGTSSPELPEKELVCSSTDYPREHDWACSALKESIRQSVFLQKGTNQLAI